MKERSKLVRFRILVRMPNGREYWEDYAKDVDSSTYVCGYGRQPTFDGNIDKWGQEIIAWFNGAEPQERHRTFVRAEKIAHGSEHTRAERPGEGR